MPTSLSSACLAAIGLVGPALAQITFAPAAHFPAGRSPAGGASLDFDADGHTDVVVACRGDDALAFLRNLGPGAFAAPVVLALASNSNPEGVATGDFDRDGDLDLAVTLYGASQMQLVLGDGRGNFVAGATFAVGNEPSMIVATDFNGDGWLDVAINERGAGDVAVLLSNAAAGFAPAAFYPVGGETRDVVAGDVTGDGIPDLAVSSRDDRRIRVFVNLGNGVFQILRDISYGSQLRPHGLGMADMDRDGWLDIYSVSRGSVFAAPQVVLRFNGGNPWIGPINGAFAGVEPTGVCHGDFDLDGVIDIATCNSGSNDVSIMRNAGMGIFNRGVEIPVGTDPDCPTMLAVDLDHDTDIDLVTFNAASNDISVLLNATRVCQENLGFGGPGLARLSICGQPLATGRTADLRITGAAPNAPGWIAASLSFGQLPIFGGVLVPIGLELVLPFSTNASGEALLPQLRGGGGPAAVAVQVVLLDATQPQGFALSNAVRMRLLP